MKSVYICHQFSDDIPGNQEKVRTICRDVIFGHDMLPIASHLYLSEFLDDETNRELALRLCVEMVSRCDELWICGPRVTAGMEIEIEAATKLKIPIISYPLMRLKGEKCGS